MQGLVGCQETSFYLGEEGAPGGLWAEEAHALTQVYAAPSACCVGNRLDACW